MAISEEAKEFIIGGPQKPGLNTPRLKVFCNINYDKKSEETGQRILPEDKYKIACELQYEALLELIRRLEGGDDDTADDPWAAAKFRKKAKALRDKHKFRDSYLLYIKKPTNPFNSELLHALTTGKTPIRLNVGRGIRILGLIWPIVKDHTKWFKYLGLENIIEFFADKITIFKNIFQAPRKIELDENDEEFKKLSDEQREQMRSDLHDHQEQVDKIPWYKRAWRTLRKGRRPWRMANAILWFGINLAGILLAVANPIFIPLVGLTLAATFADGLSVTGTVIDIFIDAASSINDFFNHHFLLNVFKNKHDEKPGFIDKQVFDFTCNEIAIKAEESFVTKFLRMLTYDGVLSLALFLYLFPPSAIVGIVLLSAATLISLNGLATFGLQNSRENNFDKGLSIAVTALLVIGLALAIATPFGLPLAIGTIGAGLAFTVGLTGFIRRIYMNSPWVRDKVDEIKNWSENKLNEFKTWVNKKFGNNEPVYEPIKAAADITTLQGDPASHNTEITVSLDAQAPTSPSSLSDTPVDKDKPPIASTAQIEDHLRRSSGGSSDLPLPRARSRSCLVTLKEKEKIKDEIATAQTISWLSQVKAPKPSEPISINPKQTEQQENIHALKEEKSSGEEKHKKKSLKQSQSVGPMFSYVKHELDPSRSQSNPKTVVAY